MARDDVDTLLRRLQDLRIQEDDIIRRIEVARADEAETARPFAVGDRVKILNNVRYFGLPSARDRTGTVTKITAKRVFLQTDNGNETNRAPKNLALIVE